MWEQQVNRLQKEAEATLKLKINWVRTAQELFSAENAGLLTSYRDIFAEQPYNEFFEIDGVRDYFSDILASDGFIFTAQQNARVVAFVASLPLDKKTAVAPVVAPYIDITSSCYFAEDAVIPGLRRMGISRGMKLLLLESNRALGFQNMVLRTSQESAVQTAAVSQIGFKQIDSIFQDIDSLKLDGTVRADRRIFFTLDLSQQERCPQ